MKTVLAKNVLIDDIPRTPYMIKSTETEIILIIPAFIDFNPDTLNLKSKGEWITVYIELPTGYDINAVNLETIRLNNQIQAECNLIIMGDYDNNGIPDLMIKFNRSDVQNILEVGDEIKTTIIGETMNGDGFTDVVIHVVAEELNLTSSDTKAELKSVQYNNQDIIEFPKTEFKYEWSIDKKTGDIKNLEQRIKVKDEFDIKAKYNHQKDETEIKIKQADKEEIKQTLPGLVIIKLITKSGVLEFEY